MFQKHGTATVAYCTNDNNSCRTQIDTANTNDRLLYNWHSKHKRMSHTHTHNMLQRHTTRISAQPRRASTNKCKLQTQIQTNNYKHRKQFQAKLLHRPPKRSARPSSTQTITIMTLAGQLGLFFMQQPSTLLILILVGYAQTAAVWDRSADREPSIHRNFLKFSYV